MDSSFVLATSLANHISRDVRYTYETIDKPHRRFEIDHPMKDPALTHHPETGVPIRRLITGAPSFKVRASRFDMTQAHELHLKK